MPYKCSFCDRSFTQSAHLRRHLLHHTDGKKRYQCSCGHSYSRSDVLQRHLRSCDKAKQTLDQVQNTPDKRTRSKKACNQCARSKQKCDYDQPCQRCKQKSFDCEYTRQGYQDPYQVFRYREDSTTTIIDANSAVYSANDQSQVQLSPEHANPEGTGPLARTAELNQMESVHFVADVNDPDDAAGSLALYDFDLNDVGLDLGDFDWNSLLMFSEGLDDFAISAGTHNQTARTRTNTHFQPPVAASAFAGFQLQQLDSVEAKCVELRNFLRLSPANISEVSSESLITRDSLLHCIQLYGKDYHPLMPILHLPSFELTKTPPVLLMAMMLVGACYAEGLIPASQIVRLALHTLLVIEGLPHERNMSEPPLPVIQASALLCHILVITKNSSAYEFASVHRARMISMAERAGLFRPAPVTEYWLLTKTTFDWYMWIDSEAHRRLAYHIFSTDQGNRIFMRGSTHLRPSNFNVETPTSHSCWAAQTANECLQHLQNRPGQTQLAMALRQLRSAAPNERILEDLSDSSMHAIIVGLHGLLCDIFDASLDDENIIPVNSPSNDHDIRPNLEELLNYHLLNHSIDQIANNIVSTYGTDSMKHVNKAFNKWRMVWDSRKIYDVYDESNTAFNHPSNFFLLAKLFIVLHFLRNRAGENQLGGRSEDMAEYFAYWSVNDGKTESRIQSQMQVLNWLSRLRRRPGLEQLRTNSLVSQVINT